MQLCRCTCQMASGLCATAPHSVATTVSMSLKLLCVCWWWLVEECICSHYNTCDTALQKMVTGPVLHMVVFIKTGQDQVTDRHRVWRWGPLVFCGARAFSLSLIGFSLCFTPKAGKEVPRVQQSSAFLISWHTEQALNRHTISFVDSWQGSLHYQPGDHL